MLKKAKDKEKILKARGKDDSSHIGEQKPAPYRASYQNQWKPQAGGRLSIQSAERKA